MIPVEMWNRIYTVKHKKCLFIFDRISLKSLAIFILHFYAVLNRNEDSAARVFDFFKTLCKRFWRN